MIIAVDFDGTLCKNAFPEIGEPNLFLIYSLKGKQILGDKLILWTCRAGDRLQEALDFCAKYGLYFDEINANLPETLEMFGGDSRKIHADLYIDDKSCIPELFKAAQAS